MSKPAPVDNQPPIQQVMGVRWTRHEANDFQGQEWVELYLYWQ